ncbi:WXG100 family type VII secretion target [Nonomuraea sp. CA-143628]|uniref:WXG100 family type VII secretion target n=1 Tax=Nonomuraea sp. CA-143628 TaxID=3239997 RepID=UPI003D8E5AF6
MDFYDQGTTLYTTAIAECVIAAGLPSNPAIQTISRFAGALIGTILSSPSDIRGAARHTRDMTTTVNDAAASIDTALDTIDSDDWEKMARPDVDSAVKKFTKEAKNSTQAYEGLAQALDQLAGHSFQGAVTSASVASILVALSGLSAAGKLFPPTAVATDLSATASSVAALAVLKSIVGKSKGVYMAAAGIASAAGMYMGQSAAENMSKAVTPTDPKNAPAFEQVYIPNLPTFDKDGQPLGMKGA